MKYNQEEVIKLIKDRWPEADCSKVIYKNIKTKITVICPVHGPFEVLFDELINPKRKFLCKNCASDSQKTCYEISYLEDLIKSYKGTKSEFPRKHYSEYKFIKSNKLDYLLDLIPPKLSKDGKDLKRSVYVYEFPNKIAYIGLTNSIERRDYEHRNKKGDNLFEYCHANKLDLPEIKILEENISAFIVGSREVFWENYYKETLNYVTLNKAKCGALGGSTGYKVSDVKKLTYSLDDCKNIIEQGGYKNITDCSVKNYTLYTYIKYKSWEKELFPNYQTFTTLTLDQVEDIFNKYSTVKDLKKENKRVYEYAKSKGWITKYNLTSHMKISGKAPIRTKQDCLDIINKYDIYQEFREKEPAIYKYVRKNKWEEELFADLLRKTDEFYIKIIKKYKTRKDLLHGEDRKIITYIISSSKKRKSIINEFNKLPKC